MTHRLAVLISGTGSNLQAILDAISASCYHYFFCAIIIITFKIISK